MDDVMPFLENVLRGRNVPRERLLAVAKHYELFNGISPINAQNRELIAALKEELRAAGIELPIYWGNRNWHPLLADTVRQMTADGVQNALAFVTSAYNSYAGCRQYLEDIERARAALGANAPRIDKLRAFYNHPGFIEANVENVRVALSQIPPERRAATHLVFTAHSIPIAMAGQCKYEMQLNETAALVAGEIECHNWQLVFQSRSGPPTQPWLEPDVCDYLKILKANGAVDVIISPIGFVSDHMEIVYDLDTEARAVCHELGLNMIRAATAGTRNEFTRMIVDLIKERLDPATPRRFLGTQGVPDDCLADCCLSGRASNKE
jgi:ferrochelatase